jgi:hypothetical protein
MNDHPSPAAPFSGDETGAIFDAPDLVLQSPTTTERVVETQSGFLVVVRRTEELRQALSVKRRLGTPPTSSVLLTPDESLKLSRILGDSVASPARRPVTNVDRFASDQRLAISAGAQARKRSSTFVRNWLRGILLPITLTVLLGLALAVMTKSIRLPAPNIVLNSAPAAESPLDPKNVEKFVHGFVANMLDFNPETYKVSQIRAMADMTPDLVESYWRDTHFPLTQKQLKALPQDTTVLINKITANPVDSNTTSADVFAQLVNGKTKLGSPIHLRLKLSVYEEGALKVSEQKDLTASK